MIVKRPRNKQSKSFQERLALEAAEYSELAKRTPPGPQRDLYMRRAHQAETAAHLDDWLRSPGLQPPKKDDTPGPS